MAPRPTHVVGTVLVAVCVALPGWLAPNAAAFGEPSAIISGEVEQRDGPVLDSFRHDSGGLDNWTKTDSADDPGSNGTSSAGQTYTTTTGGNSVTVDVRGDAAANTGASVRKASGSSSFSKEFLVTDPARFTATGSMSVASTPGFCCVGAEARLINRTSGNNVFVAGLNTGDPGRSVNEAGILQPGLYQLILQANAGMGFGAVASANVVGSAAFAVTFTLTAMPPDSDGDGLPNSWETAGVDVDGDGAIDLDLPAMGADPQHKDIFVELDFMAPHEFEQAAVDPVVQAFAAAPVANPDGTQGIALHVDNGPGSVMNPRTGELWGARSGHGAVPHVDELGSAGPQGYDWTDFDALKALHFAEEREPAFHYAISAHGHNGTVSGTARDIPSSDFLITLGAGCEQQTGSDCTLDASAQAGTFMHELGHNLGLHHGGDDDLLNKPNYLSVMNYNFQLTGLMRSNLSFVFDFSRFSISVNEAALDEAHGFGASGPAAGFNTIGACPGGTQAIWFVADGPTDFNCNGATGGTVSADISGDGATTALSPFVDWPALVYTGGAVGGAGVALPTHTPLIEPPLDELLASREVLQEYAAAQQTPPTTPAAPITSAPADQAPPSSAPADQAPGGGAPADEAPALSALSVSPRAFLAARRGPTVGGPATVRFRASRSGLVRFRVERRAAGRRAGGRCVPVTRRNRRGRSCVRHVALPGSFTHTASAGANRLRFSGRLSRRALRPARYRLVATPLSTQARRPGAPARTAFRIVRPVR